MNKLRFEEFSSHLVEELSTLCKDDENVGITESTKVNVSVPVAVYSIKGMQVAPAIRVDHLYQVCDGDYGKAMEFFRENAPTGKELLHKISNEYDEIHVDCYSGIMPQLISKKQNAGLLDSVISVDFLDMALIARKVVSIDEKGMTSFVLTDSVFNKFVKDTTIDEYFDMLVNSIDVDDIRFTTMTGMLQSMVPKVELPLEDIDMYVLTNKANLNGAGVIASPKVQEYVYKKMKGSYIILPSSIHEVIILPDIHDVDYLRDMVLDINSTVVSPEDYLSDQVYRYDGEKIDIA